MEAYIGFANYTLNFQKEKSQNYILNLRDVYKSIEPMSVRRPSFDFIKSLTIESIEVCSASRGCTPKSRFNNNKNHKHINYLTVFKNSNRSIKTDKNIPNWINDKTKKPRTNYVLLNIKASCVINGIIENIAIRIPKSGVLGVKIGLSSQQSIIIKDPAADNKLKILGDELSSIIYDILPVPYIRPTVLSGMIVQGWNLNDPSGGKKPDHRIKNFISTMRALDSVIKSHNLDYEPRETKMIPRVNFRSILNEPTVGITTWLMVDFSGVKSIAKVRDISVRFYNAYRSIKRTINWNTNYEGPIPKSRRGIKQKKKAEKKPNINNVNIPIWNKDKKKFLQKDTVFSCMRLSKNEISKLAEQLDLNPNGFKASVCDRIMTKLNNSK